LDDPDSALIVQPGIETPAPPPVRRRPRRQLSAREYIDGVLGGDRVVLARAVTLVESRRPEDTALAQDVLEACLPHTGNSIRVGITGVPGAGKSTFIEALGTQLTARGEKLAILAVDPSSEVSGGSILGDKTRMEKLATDPNAFIRPTPSGGALGGVARRTRETLLLCEAAGYRNVFIETVGVGQSETMVRAMVDCFLLLLLPGAGDELQGMKRGIVELTDLMAINKADGDLALKAEVARRQYESALHLFPAPASGWTPRVVTCSARTGAGVRKIWEIVLEHDAWLRHNGLLETLRRNQSRRWMHDMLQAELIARFRAHPRVRERLPEIETAAAEGRITAFRAVQQLLDFYTEAST